MEIVLTILATSILIGGLAYVISRSLIRAKIINHMKNCDYKSCEKYCTIESKCIQSEKLNDDLHIELRTKHVQYNLLKKQSRDALKEDRQLFAEIIKRIE